MLKKLIPVLERLARLDPQKTWGIPLVLAGALGLLLLGNLLFVGSKNPGENLTQTTLKAVATEDSQAQTPEEDQVDPLPQRPEPDLWPTRIFEVKPGLWRLQGRDYVYTEQNLPHILAVMRQRRLFLPLASEQPGHLDWALESELKLSVSRKSNQSQGNLSFDRSRQLRYALQVASVPQEEVVPLVVLAAKLMEAGYYSYLYASEQTKPTDQGNQRFFQLRIGYYAAEHEVLDLAEELKAKCPAEPLLQARLWPVLPSAEEVDSELVNFRVQKNQPWGIELGAYRDRGQAMQEMASLGPELNFLYLSQAKSEGKWLYRLFGGFYVGQTEAQKGLDLLRKKTGLSLAGARLVSRKFKVQPESSK